MSTNTFAGDPDAYDPGPPAPTWSRPQNAELWHYTSIEKLTKIVTSRSLRLTHYAYLNDSSEYEYACALFEAELKRRIASGGTDEEVWRLALNRLPDIRAWPRFVFALSEHEDDLGQWRAYGHGGQGCAIGFDWQLLEQHLTYLNLVNNLGILLKRCVYSPEEHTAAIEAALRPVPITYAQIGDAENSFQEQASLEMLALKHPKFWAEREFRFVTDGLPARSSLMTVEEGGAPCRPFVQLRIAGSDLNDGHFPINRILIGPLATHRADWVSEFLEQNHVSPSVELSEIPLQIPPLA